MFRSRSFELAAIEKMKTGQIPGALHTSVGQEASIVGLLHGAARGRLHGGQPPLARPPDRQGRADGPAVRRADGQGDRDQLGAGRLHAPVRLQRRQPRRDQHRGLGPAGRGRRRAGLEDAGQRPGDAVLLRRRRLQRGHVPREPEPGRDLAAACRVPVREQRLRRAERGQPDGVGARRVHARGRVRHPRRDRGRAGRRRRLRGGRRGRRAGPPGRRPVAGGDQDLPVPRPRLRAAGG